LPYADPEKGKAWAAAYRAKNREKEREKQKAWVEANKQHRLEWEKAYRQRDHVKSMRSDGKVRDRIVRKEAFVEPVSRDKVWTRDNGICGICGSPANNDDWHLDHVIPLARGGLHCYDNVQVSHPLCNMRKGKKTNAEIQEEDWVRENRSRYRDRSQEMG
jgi:5-methylcytosine-specific restriction endonuclease McrA